MYHVQDGVRLRYQRGNRIMGGACRALQMRRESKWKEIKSFNPKNSKNGIAKVAKGEMTLVET